MPGYGYRLTATPHDAPKADAAQAAAHDAFASADRPRHNLPDPRTRFIGREAALTDMAGLLPSTRLLTLTGIGGCGKTRLALRFAQQQIEAFADGVWFVDLAPLQDAARVVATCAAVLGIQEEGDTPPIARLLDHLASRRALLVLDNCEHVLDGAVTLVDALLAAGGNTTILATSREGLGVSGEQIYPVRSLSLPATNDVPAVLAAESSRVFVDRARLTVPDFDVDASNAPALAEICRRLDGIALAIELAAARVTMLSVAEIAARLDDRFRLLVGGSRALPRHQTLHAAMQWSYEQLTAAEQRMLRQVSVFAGGWTLEAAAEVAQTTDEYEALALLTALHDKSLLAVDRDIRFRGRYEEALAYAQQALDAARQISAPHAIAWSLNAVGSALTTLGRRDAAIQTLEDAFERARVLGDGVLMFTVLNNIASSRYQAGQLDAAERCYVEALELARLHAGRVGVVVVLDNLIRVLVAQGELNRAHQFAIECLPLARHEKVGADLLDATVGLASRLGEHAVAARWWGTSDQLLLAWDTGTPAEVAHLAPLLASSRRALGDAAFEAAAAAGRALPLEQAMLELDAWLGRA